MIPEFDEAQTHGWLSNLYGETTGFINICSTGNWSGASFRDIDEAVDYIKRLDATRPQGIYARATTLRRKPKSGSRGSAEDSYEFVGFWADLDIAGPGHKTSKPLPASVDDCLAIVEASALPAPTEWIHSGGGMYPWWLLVKPESEDLDTISDLSARWQRVIELASEKLGFSYGSGVGDLTRVLRIPGTVNRKVPEAPVLAQWRTDLSISQPYEPRALAAALAYSEKQLQKPKPVQVPAPTPRAQTAATGTMPGDAYNAATTWTQLLQADGAQIFEDSGTGYIEWTRPGKDRRRGMSATTGYMGADVLKVFSDAWLPLQQGETYSRFGYYAATRHNGDFSAAAKELSRLGYGERGQQVQYWDYDAEKPTVGIESQTAEAAETAAPPPSSRPTYTLTDSGFADRLQARYGRHWRYIGTRDEWMCWNGQVWELDSRGQVTNLVDELVREELERSAGVEDEKEREKTQRMLRAMQANTKQVGATKIFSRRPQIASDYTDFDTHRHMVTCGNGVINLTDMSFGGHDSTLLATRRLGVDYDPQAQAPRWEKFLQEVIPDPLMRDYFQRAIGYTMTGDTDRKAIFMLHGLSNCGKSQVINALAAVFGDFCTGADASAFERRDNNQAPNPGLHKLQGARFVHASESDEGMRLNETLIKRITGGDLVHSRTLYGKEETWKPQFTIFIATNHLPRLSSDDDAIWRRVKPIHLPVVFGTSEHPETLDIGRKLAAAEGSGILNWILRGVELYRKHGLVEPEALKDGVAEYQADSDPVARFIATSLTEGHLVKEDDAFIEARVLYSWFTAWCADEGIRFPLAANRFGRRLGTLGYRRERDPSGSKRVWAGLGAVGQGWIVSGQRLSP